MKQITLVLCLFCFLYWIYTR